MTHRDARRRVAEDVYRESQPIADLLNVSDQRESVARAFASLSGHIIDRYLLYILADIDQKKGLAS